MQRQEKDGDKLRGQGGPDTAKRLARPIYPVLPGLRPGIQRGRRQDARKKYQNKVVELTGTLVRIGLSPDRQPILWLERARGGTPGRSLHVGVEGALEEGLPGQTVTVKGKGSQSGLGAALAECEIVGTKDDAPETLTADKLAEEHAKDLDATIKKYDQKMLTVEGEIAKVELNQSDHPEITLKTAKGSRRHLPELHRSGTQAGQGSQGRAEGQGASAFTALNADKESIGLYDAITIEPPPDSRFPDTRRTGEVCEGTHPTHRGTTLVLPMDRFVSSCKT